MAEHNGASTSSSLREVHEEFRARVADLVHDVALEEEIDSPIDSLEHRWMTADGYGIVLTVCDITSAARPGDLELFGIVRRTLSRYREWYRGEVDEFVEMVSERFSETWVCRLIMTAPTGEPLRVNMLAGLEGDGIVVVVQTMRSGLIPDTEEDRGLHLLAALAGSPEARTP